MSMIFMLSPKQWEDLIQRMHGEGVQRPALHSDAEGIGISGTMTDMILWLTHIAELVENEDKPGLPAMQHLRYLVDQVEHKGANDWWLYNVHVTERV